MHSIITRIEEYMGWAVAVIRLGRRMEVSGSAVLNGGNTVTDTLMIMEVPKDYDGDPIDSASRARDGLSLPDDTVVFMTAAEVKYVFSTVETDYKGTSAWAAATAGLSNQVVAGEVLTGWEKRHELSKKRAAKFVAGTINIIGVSPVALTEAAKYNMVIAMTEAKTVALNSLGYKETGTTSDAIAVVSPIEGERTVYTGTGTDLGIAMARSVRDAVRTALVKRGDFPVPETVTELLESVGVKSSDLSSSFSLDCNARLEDLGSDSRVRELVRMAVIMQREVDLGLSPGNVCVAKHIGSLIAACVGGSEHEELYYMALSEYEDYPAGVFVRCVVSALSTGFN